MFGLSLVCEGWKAEILLWLWLIYTINADYFRYMSYVLTEGFEYLSMSIVCVDMVWLDNA